MSAGLHFLAGAAVDVAGGKRSRLDVLQRQLAVQDAKQRSQAYRPEAVILPPE